MLCFPFSGVFGQTLHTIFLTPLLSRLDKKERSCTCFIYLTLKFVKKNLVLKLTYLTLVQQG